MKAKLSLKTHSELPLRHGGANLFLQVMTAVSVFLFALMLSAFLLLDGVAKEWRGTMDNTLTVQIMPDENINSTRAELERRQKVVLYFQELPSVESVRLIPDDEMQKLMAPWLGAQADLSVLPLPALLDVRLKNGASLDYDDVMTELAETAPYASIDNHRLWLGRLVKFVAILRLVALVALGMVLAVSALSISYAVCTSLSIHRDIIEILHIMGAKDNYVANQYAQHSFYIGLTAGAVGMILGGAAICLLGKLSQNLNMALLSGLSLSWTDWLSIVSLPLWAAVLSMITAWLSVKRTLRKMI